MAAMQRRYAEYAETDIDMQRDRETERKREWKILKKFFFSTDREWTRGPTRPPSWGCGGDCPPGEEGVRVPRQ